MKVLGIISLLLALLYVASMSGEQSNEAVVQKEQAQRKIDDAQKKVAEAMQKQLDNMKERDPE